MAVVKNSVSNWEDSYFGGFQRVLFDFPQIDVPWNIDVEFPKVMDAELTYYTRKKLSSLFQLKIKEHELFGKFMKGAKIEISKNFLGKKVENLVPTVEAISDCVTAIAARDSELANLFKHYRSTLKSTKFLYPVDSEKEPKKESKGEDDGSKEDKSDDSKAPTAAQVASASDLIDQIKARKPFELWGGRATSVGSFNKEVKYTILTPSETATIYTHQEDLNANNLVKLLDVNFDPHSDRVNDLRYGKLDVSKLATVLSGNRNVYYTVEENQTTRPFSVCFLGDESGSMGGLPHHDDIDTTFPAGAQHSLMKMLYKTFSQILPQSKIFIYGHSGLYEPVVRVYHDPYNQSFDYTIESQRFARFEENYDGPVIESIYKRIRGVTSDNILFISLSDGMPSGRGYGGWEAAEEMKRIIEKCKRDGFVTVGIGLFSEHVKNIYNYNCVIRDLKDVPKRVSTIINTVVKTEFKDE